jgi:hypothetical protein
MLQKYKKNFKLKLESSWCMPWRHVIGIEVQLHTFPASVSYGGERWALRPGRFLAGIKHQPTNQPTKEVTEGEDLRENASRRSSVCIAIPALTASLDSVTDTLNYNRDCAYANNFPSLLKTPTWGDNALTKTA